MADGIEDFLRTYEPIKPTINLGREYKEPEYLSQERMEILGKIQPERTDAVLGYE